MVEFRTDVAGFPLGSAQVEVEMDGGRYAPGSSPEGVSISLATTGHGPAVQVENLRDVAVQLGNIWVRFPASQWPAEVTAAKTLQLLRPWFNVLVSSVHRLDTPAATERSSWGMTALRRNDTGEAVLFGVIGAVCETEYIIRYVDTHKQGAFGLDIRFDMCLELAPGKSRRTPALAILGDAPVDDLLTRYADCWAQAVPPRPRRRVTGWNSWDYYGGSVRQSDVVENAEVLTSWAADPTTDRPDPEQWAIIDDGWQSRWGEWTMIDRFPGGLKGTAEAIMTTGANPGIWSAPLAMYVHCPFARENRECCVRDAQGNIIFYTFTSGAVVLLDPSHPKVQAYLRETFSRIREAGFRYFKVDFSQYLFKPEVRQFHDRSLTRLEIAALAIDTIRDAVGEDAIMASGTFPYELLAGRFESARATSDIHLYWTHIWQCGMQIGAGYWMDEKLFTLDPDFLIVRSDTTSDDAHLNYLSPGQNIPLGDDWWQAGPAATENELRVLATMVALTGGDFILSDRLSALNAAGWAMIDHARSAHCDRCAKPLDLWERGQVGEPPARWLGHRAGQPVTGVINWSDAARTFDLSDVSGTDVWTGVAAGESVTLAARTGALYR